MERRADPADRRRKLVSLTSQGKEAVARVIKIQREPPPGFGTLSAVELDTLEELVRRIASGPPRPLASPAGDTGGPGDARTSSSY